MKKLIIMFVATLLIVGCGKSNKENEDMKESKGTIETIMSRTSIPEHIVPLDIIALGHPAEQPEPKDKWKPERVHQNKW